MATAIVMPSYGMYTAEGTLVRWLKPADTHVAAGEVVAEIETEKALAELVAPAGGILHHVAVPGTRLEVEALVGYILAPGERPPTLESDVLPETSVRAPQPAPAPPRGDDRRPASPNARRLALELGVDLDGVTGTGPGGRITEDDVRDEFRNAS